MTAKRLADAVQGSAQDLQRFSKAALGDKTMLDALFPFVDTLVGQVDAGASISEAWRSAAEACRAAAEATASLVPRIGRARPLAERSVGTPDPGAVSLGLIVTAIGDVLGDAEAAAPKQQSPWTRKDRAHERSHSAAGRKRQRWLRLQGPHPRRYAG